MKKALIIILAILSALTAMAYPKSAETLSDAQSLSAQMDIPILLEFVRSD